MDLSKYEKMINDGLVGKFTENERNCNLSTIKYVLQMAENYFKTITSEALRNNSYLNGGDAAGVINEL